MNFSKSLFLSVLFLSLNNFCMFRGPQILKTLSKTSLNKQKLFLHNKIFFSPVPMFRHMYPNDSNKKSFKELKSEPFVNSETKKTISNLDLNKFKNIDADKAVVFLDRYLFASFEPFELQKLTNGLLAASLIELEPNVALELLEFLKEDKDPESRDNFDRIRVFFNSLDHEQKMNKQMFKSLSPRLQKLVLSKFGEKYYKMSGKEFNEYVLEITHSDMAYKILFILAGAFVIAIMADHFEVINLQEIIKCA